MCVLFVAWKTRADAPIIVAANRDEAHDRPALPLHRWEDCPRVIAGRDGLARGTWMGVATDGRWAAITNIRDPKWMGARFERSRGHLVSDFLCGSTSPDQYAREVHDRREEYPGFNLLLGDLNTLCFVSRENDGIRELPPGHYGLSNGDLDDPWPKVARGGRAFRRWTRGPLDGTEGLMLLHDRHQAPDELLPDTGVGMDMERLLSPLFIVGDGYGTRASTVLIVREEDSSVITERSFAAHGTPDGASRIEFHIRPRAEREVHQV